MNQSTSSSNLEAITVGNGGQNGDRRKTRKTDEMKGSECASCEGDMDKEMENIEGDRVRKRLQTPITHSEKDNIGVSRENKIKQREKSQGSCEDLKGNLTPCPFCSRCI